MTAEAVRTGLPAALPGLYRYALHLTRDPDRADDLVQETALRALERADTFRGESGLPTWLHRVMHHRYVDGLRRDATTATHTAPEAAAGEDLAEAVEAAWREDAYTVDGETVALRAETRDRLWDALVRLPITYRAAVVLHDVEGFTSAEVAQIHELSLPAAKQRLRRGRQMLVSALAAETARREALAGVPLRCWEARARVDEYLDDELAPADRAALERHLSGCPTCPGLYAGLVGVRDALGALRDPDSVVPPALAERLREAGITPA